MVKKIKLQATSRRFQAAGKLFIRCFCAGCILFWSSCAPALYKNTFVAAGTYLEIQSPHRDAAGIVHEEFKRLEKIFNFYDPDSELSRLNRSAEVPFKASKELLEVLRLSFQVNAMSNGAFDVTYGRLYEFWKERIKKGAAETFPSSQEIAALKEFGGMDNIVIDENAGTVLIKKKGLKIDLGGIAEGFMVDKAVLKLKEKGIDSALINAGGDIYCLGTNRGKPWRIGVKDPQGFESIIQSEQLVDEAIATSGDYEQFFNYQGKRYSHLISPRTGFPVANAIVSVSVVTKNCTSADSLGTAFFVMGMEEIRQFLVRNPSTMRIFIITEDERGRHLHVLK